METHSIQLIIAIITTFLVSFTLFTFGELLPKRIKSAGGGEGIKHPLLINFFSTLAKPFLRLGYAIVGLMLNALGLGQNLDADEIFEQEMRTLVDVGEEAGVIEEEQSDMIGNIFEFDETTVEEIMTHRTELIAINSADSIEQVVKTAIQTGFSRIPVYVETMDNIKGVLYVKDLLELVGGNRKNNAGRAFNLDKYIRKPIFIPEATRCTELLKQFKMSKVHFAVVVDEYGGTSGAVTMEDLLEAIVGNIQDEYDNETEEYTEIAADEYMLDGNISIDEVEKLFDIDFPDDTPYDTLGGYLTGQLGGVPTDGGVNLMSVEFADIIFTVVGADDRKISTIRGQRKKLIDSEGYMLEGKTHDI